MNDKYKNDLREWETKMLAQGKQKLVSKTFIKSIRLNLSKADQFPKKSKSKKRSNKLKKSAKKVDKKSVI